VGLIEKGTDGTAAIILYNVKVNELSCYNELISINCSYCYLVSLLSYFLNYHKKL